MKDSNFENLTVLQEILYKIKNASSDKEIVEALYTLSLAATHDSSIISMLDKKCNQ